MKRSAQVWAHLALAVPAMILGAIGAVWSWRVRDYHGVVLSLVVLTSAVLSVVVVRLSERQHSDHAA